MIKKLDRSKFEKKLRDHLVFLETGNVRKRADFSNTELINLNLSGLNLAKSNFDGCVLYDVLARNSDFSWASFRGARFENCNFQDSQLNDANFTDCVITDSIIPRI